MDGTQSSYSLAYLKSVNRFVAIPVWLFRSTNELEKKIGEVTRATL